MVCLVYPELCLPLTSLYLVESRCVQYKILYIYYILPPRNPYWIIISYLPLNIIFINFILELFSQPCGFNGNSARLLETPMEISGYQCQPLRPTVANLLTSEWLIHDEHHLNKLVDVPVPSCQLEPIWMTYNAPDVIHIHIHFNVHTIPVGYIHLHLPSKSTKCR